MAQMVQGKGSGVRGIQEGNTNLRMSSSSNFVIELSVFSTDCEGDIGD